ncbi:MAG: hypothetical protein P8M27_01195 [Flavobacteriaceae bacterium]|nr:hypothetical protein [Flavobacteriaceae bacterium]
MSKKLGLFLVLVLFISGLIIGLLEKAANEKDTSAYEERKAQMEDNKKIEADRLEYTWYKINDGFSPPLLTFLNGCWASETSEDVFFTDVINGDFYFNSKTNLKQEVWFMDFDTMEARFNGTKTWGGDLYRNKLGNKIRVNRINYSKVDCSNTGFSN